MSQYDRDVDRVRGCLMGAIIGDAMGMPVEGMKPKEVVLLNGGKGVEGFLPPMGREIFGTQHLKAGDTTDDWQLLSAVARSLIRTKGVFDLEDCAQQHVHELEIREIGWGGTTENAIRSIKEGDRYVRTDPLPPALPNQGAGNGVMMKIAPLAIIHQSNDWQGLWSDCRSLGSMTHADIRASITAFAVGFLMQDSLLSNLGCGTLFALEKAMKAIIEIEHQLEVTEGRVSDRLMLVPETLSDNVALEYHGWDLLAAFE